MERSEALALLGLGPDASAAQTRRAYRRRLLTSHPDQLGGADGGPARRLIEAYALIVATADSPSVALPDDNPFGDERDVDCDTLSFDAPADAAFAMLVEVAHRLGDVTYLDRQSGLFEVLLRTEQGITVSVVVSLQGRADCIDAFFTLEALDVRERSVTPSVGSIVSRFADLLS